MLDGIAVLHKIELHRRGLGTRPMRSVLVNYGRRCAASSAVAPAHTKAKMLCEAEA